MVEMQSSGDTVTTTAAALQVEHSVTGRRWEFPVCDERLATALCQGHDLPDIIGRALAARGIGLEDVGSFLNPTLRGMLPDPSVLKDMDRAAERFAAAIISGERMAVFGDYDVDGATSTALLVRFCRAVGGDVQLYIPDRIAEGYGPNATALLNFRKAGVTLLATVDCGITAYDPLAQAADAGLDVIVIDHHTAELRLPRAYAVVNPNRVDESGALRNLAAVGVTFLTVVAINRVLRSSGWYRTRPEPSLLQWLDLVALGTICDVVPLVGVNRALVAQGLKVMARRGNAGMAALADIAGVHELPGCYHAGFMMGPRVNAGGRIGQADLGATLLSTDDPAEAAEIAKTLDSLNRQRQEIEAQVMAQALAQLERREPDKTGVLLVAGEGWHPGVIGIIASRLTEKLSIPVCAIAVDGETAKGSGRSIPGADLGRAVLAAREAGLLLTGGGHPMAAGFTVSTERIPELQSFLSATIRAPQQNAERVLRLAVDGALSLGAVSTALATVLDRLGPFGAGNAEPRFALIGARIVNACVVGESHVRCFLTEPTGSARLKGIAFRARDAALGQALLGAVGAPMHVAGRLRLDKWNGAAEVQFMIDDLAPAWGNAG